MEHFHRYKKDFRTLLHFSISLKREISSAYHVVENKEGVIWKRSTHFSCGEQNHVDSWNYRAKKGLKSLFLFHTHFDPSRAPFRRVLPPSTEDIVHLLHLNLHNKACYSMVIAEEGCYFYSTKELNEKIQQHFHEYKLNRKEREAFLSAWRTEFMQQGQKILGTVHCNSRNLETYLNFLRENKIAINLVPWHF